MKSIFWAVLTTSVILTVPMLCIANAPPGAASSTAKLIPEGPGKAVMEQMCVGCHSLSVVTTKRATPAEWESLVQTMVSRGAMGSDHDIDTVTRYLAENFGPGAPRYALPTPPAATTKAAEAVPTPSPELSAIASEAGESSVITIHANVNRADAKELKSALSLTTEEAQSLIQYRKKNGDFQNWQEVGEIPGVPAGKIIEYRNRLLF